MISYQTSKIVSDLQLRRLYKAVGWNNYTQKFSDLSILLEKCALVYSAWDEDTLVGLIRTVSDGVSIQYVQDLLVLPDYQKQGIGKTLLQYVYDKSESIRQLVLITDNGEDTQYIRDWYKQQGLTPFERAQVAGFWRIKI